MIWTIPSTTLSVSILNSTLTSDPLFGRTCLLICHDDTRRDLRHPAKIYSPECVEGEFCELRRDGVLRSSHTSGSRKLHHPLCPLILGLLTNWRANEIRPFTGMGGR